MNTVSNGTVMCVVASALSRGLSIADVQNAAGISCNVLMNPEGICCKLFAIDAQERRE